MTQPTPMRLEVLLPFRVFANVLGVSRIVAETRQGAFGLLPHRRDCVAALAPGILVYETVSAGEMYLAVDEGVLVKTGTDVFVSVRNAIAGADLSALREAVARDFLTLSARARDLRSVLVRMESGFISRMAGLHRE